MQAPVLLEKICPSACPSVRPSVCHSVLYQNEQRYDSSPTESPKTLVLENIPSVHSNHCGLACDISENTSSEISENRHFRQPRSHMTPPVQRIPLNISIILIYQKLGSLDYIFIADSMGLSSFRFLWWAPKHVCNRIMAVQGQFGINQGCWFWYQ